MNPRAADGATAKRCQFFDSVKDDVICTVTDVLAKTCDPLRVRTEADLASLAEERKLGRDVLDDVERQQNALVVQQAETQRTLEHLDRVSNGIRDAVRALQDHSSRYHRRPLGGKDQGQACRTSPVVGGSLARVPKLGPSARPPGLSPPSAGTRQPPLRAWNGPRVRGSSTLALALVSELQSAGATLPQFPHQGVRLASPTKTVGHARTSGRVGTGPEGQDPQTRLESFDGWFGSQSYPLGLGLPTMEFFGSPSYQPPSTGGTVPSSGSVGSAAPTPTRAESNAIFESILSSMACRPGAEAGSRANIVSGGSESPLKPPPETPPRVRRVWEI